jgi:hypothetical protein
MLPRQMGREASATPAHDTSTRSTALTSREQLSIWTQTPRYPVPGLAPDMYGPVLAVVYEAAGSCTWGSTSELVDPTWALRPPSDVSVSSGGGTPTATYIAGRTGGCISGTRAAPRCTPTTADTSTHASIHVRSKWHFHCGLHSGYSYTRTPPR